MTIPSARFSLWRHLSRSQIILTFIIGLLGLAIVILVSSLYLDILITNSAFERGYIITDLSDIQQAILQLHNKNNQALSANPIDFVAIERQRGLVTSQLRLARTEAAGNAEIAADFEQLQQRLDLYDTRLAALRANPLPEQLAVMEPELDNLLADLVRQSKTISSRQESSFFTTISEALRTQRLFQTLSIILSVLLVIFGGVLLLSLRRTISSEFNWAYHQLEQEVAERKQAEAELIEANKHLQMLNTHLQDELALARQIQTSLLPPPRPNWKGLDVICYSVPADEVGGDFYAYHILDEGRFTMAVGDVSGKGLPAALLMATTIAYFESIFALTVSPEDLLARLDQTLVRYTRTTNQNCALCYAEINGLTLKVANAGGVPPYIRRANGEVEFLDVRGLPLGIGLSVEAGYQPLTVALSPGDLIILTSDGVAEAHVTPKHLFSFERLQQTVAAGPATSAKAMMNHLTAEISAFIGDTSPHDDMTIVVMQVKA
jgi:serine phosphatase RsbU (regulator of sigma subunit)